MKRNFNYRIYSYILTGLAFIFGWGLTIVGFAIPPVGIIDNSILFILGESLIFVGVVLGISEHYAAELKQLKKNLGVD